MDERKVKNTLIRIVPGDITRQTTDAIVNAANPTLAGGGGVDGAIHRAGGPAILAECQAIVARQGHLPSGQAVITTGGSLAARCVIHTVGPVWRGGRRDEAQLLASAYRESLALATERGLESISFPSISTGAYGYPVNEAARVAIGAVVTFLEDKPTTLREVVFVLFDAGTLRAYARALSAVTRGE